MRCQEPLIWQNGKMYPLSKCLQQSYVLGANLVAVSREIEDGERQTHQNNLDMK